MSGSEFLSPEWMERYRVIIRDAAAGHDLTGVGFSMYELMKAVPERLRYGRGPDILFGFRIIDGQVEFPDQPWDGASFVLVADFEAIAPWANLSTELTKAAGVMERLHQAGKLRFSGGFAEAPAFFQTLNLHDRLAEITAPWVSPPSWETPA